MRRGEKFGGFENLANGFKYQCMGEGYPTEKFSNGIHTFANQDNVCIVPLVHVKYIMYHKKNMMYIFNQSIYDCQC